MSAIFHDDTRATVASVTFDFNDSFYVAGASETISWSLSVTLTRRAFSFVDIAPSATPPAAWSADQFGIGATIGPGISRNGWEFDGTFFQGPLDDGMGGLTYPPLLAVSGTSTDGTFLPPGTYVGLGPIGSLNFYGNAGLTYLVTPDSGSPYTQPATASIGGQWLDRSTWQWIVASSFPLSSMDGSTCSELVNCTVDRAGITGASLSGGSVEGLTITGS